MKKSGIILLMVVLLLVTTQLSAVGVTSPIDDLRMIEAMETKTMFKEEVATVRSETAPLVGYTIQPKQAIIIISMFIASLIILHTTKKKEKVGNRNNFRYT